MSAVRIHVLPTVPGHPLSFLPPVHEAQDAGDGVYEFDFPQLTPANAPMYRARFRDRREALLVRCVRPGRGSISVPLVE